MADRSACHRLRARFSLVYELLALNYWLFCVAVLRFVSFPVTFLTSDCNNAQFVNFPAKGARARVYFPPNMFRIL